MRPARHGLVIGKFYPPHAGHHLLVRTAAACSDRVTVVVMASRVESVPLDVRVAWMREEHAADGNVTVVGTWDELPVDLADDGIWEGHVALMREAAQRVTDEPIDAVFTSEIYGDELARRFGARHAPVDVARGLVPISGTVVREDPAAAWPFLAPAIRGGLARRVVVIGAESTGKSTLVDDLVARLRARGEAFGDTRGVPERGREVTTEKLAIARSSAALLDRTPPTLDTLPWDTADFLGIAAAQNAREDAAARIGGPVLLCDTDAFATGVWHERYLGFRSAEVEALARPADLYLLTHPEDVPFVQDGLRDGQHLRSWMTDAFAKRLAGRPWTWLRGAREARLEAALAAIDALLASWRLAPPIGERAP